MSDAAGILTGKNGVHRVVLVKSFIFVDLSGVCSSSITSAATCQWLRFSFLASLQDQMWSNQIVVAWGNASANHSDCSRITARQSVATETLLLMRYFMFVYTELILFSTKYLQFNDLNEVQLFSPDLNKCLLFCCCT